MVIKADGLCAGKGVYICQDESQAQQALHEIFVDKVFSSQGASVVIEQFLQGFEASLLCFVSGTKIYPFDTAMDYKKIYEGDQGPPNTGGVGCISPNPYWTPALKRNPTPFYAKSNGVLKLKTWVTRAFFSSVTWYRMARFTSWNSTPALATRKPRCFCPRLRSDLLENIQQALAGEPVQLAFEDNVCMTTILVSDGYPKKHQTGFEITGLDTLPGDIMIFHNGTKQKDGKLLSAGGRVLSVTAKRDALSDARQAVYESIKKIKFDNMRYRKDIGTVSR